ncbi:DUF2180 family protein [Streptomyces bullii]|uniref:DUF2180 family protein n=1 Tax=Streptomyces bullii TaxID=349910 RepID=A0ABW0V4T2_9ACTN
MNCLDCHGTGRQTPAHGVCVQCGAAVCAQHSQISEQFLTCTKPVYRTVTIEPPVRRLMCGPCEAAHQANAACCPQSAQFARTP